MNGAMDEILAAEKRLRAADHMFTMTYSFVNDSKLLLVVLENLFFSLNHSITAVLINEKEAKNILSFGDSFESRFGLFKLNLARRFKFTSADIGFIHDIKQIIRQHKDSPIEFARGSKLVICSNDYDIYALTPERIKDYLTKTKSFVQKIKTVVD